MARLSRYVLPGQPRHFIRGGNNRQVIFANDADFQFFRDAMVSASEQHGLSIHAYVWMGNHMYLLATPAHEQSISKVFQSVGRKYVQYFNSAYQRSGTLWERRYRATVVDSEQYLLTVMPYIELNPVRAGLTAHPRDYPWSSYARNARAATGANSDRIKPHAQYQRIARSAAARLSGYRAMFKAAIAKSELAQIRDCTHKGWALGGDQFKQETETRAQRQASSKGVGRPRVAEAEDGSRV